MRQKKRLGWLVLLAPALVCIPCLLAPLAIAGGAVLISAVGGWLTGLLWVAAGILLAGLLVAGGLTLRLRRPTAACKLPQASSVQPTAADALQQSNASLRSPQ